jgi:hypothetical protein
MKGTEGQLTALCVTHAHHSAAVLSLQVRRKMEDENRKSRRVARREYLDNVRELVAFVKKRDKRVAKAQVSHLLGLCLNPELPVSVPSAGHPCVQHSLAKALLTSV